jgi:hypothetical protein
MLSELDIGILRDKAPQMHYDNARNTIIGQLDFHMQYQDNGEIIHDSYGIEIDLNRISKDGLPVVRETYGRIISIAKQWGVPHHDLHITNDNGEMCIIHPAKVKERYPHGFDLSILIDHIQEHLYWISYYEKYGKEPWPAYGHGELGYLELYLEDKRKYSEIFNQFIATTCHCFSRPERRRKFMELRRKYKL